MSNDAPLPENWFREEYERAKARSARIPKWARPVVVTRRPEPQHQGCRCGHPGAGCSCR